MPFKTPGRTSEYIRSVMPAERDPDLRAILEYADANVIPVLLPETSAFLKQLIMLKRPASALEIGTAIGYSAQIILKAYEKCKLYTVEISEDAVRTAKRFMVQAGLDDRITFFNGDAAEIVPLLAGRFDFIFLDGAKTRYIEYLPYMKNLLAPGGILLCDNVLFNGMVDGSGTLQYKKLSIVRKLDEFLRALMRDPDLCSSILPVGDGVSLSIKKGNV